MTRPTEVWVSRIRVGIPAHRAPETAGGLTPCNRNTKSGHLITLLRAACLVVAWTCKACWPDGSPTR